MAKTPPIGWAPNQVVAHNMTRARELRGMTQVEVAERLTRLAGTKWSQATVAQAEGTVHGSRMRNFTVNELYALARTFDLPIVWFLTPPDPDADVQAAGATFPDTNSPQDWRRLVLYALGHRGNYGHLARHLAPWHDAIRQPIRVPAADVIDDEDAERQILARDPQDREATTIDDALVASLYGLATMALPGQPLGPDDVLDVADSLHRVATALEALGSYPPSRTVGAARSEPSEEAPDPD